MHILHHSIQVFMDRYNTIYHLSQILFVDFFSRPKNIVEILDKSLRLSRNYLETIRLVDIVFEKTTSSNLVKNS